MYSKISEIHKSKKLIVPLDTGLRDDPEENTEDNEDPEVVVNRAETRAREEQKKTFGPKKNTKIVNSKRKYAEALHRQADKLHHRGNYEAALILYVRAAKVYPRETSHSVAASRTSAAIRSATNPSNALRKVLSEAKNPSQLAANFCPETAALRAKKIVEESSDPVLSISQILKYFDSRKDFWRDSSSIQNRQHKTLLSRSKMMLRQLSGLANVTLDDLQVASASGDLNKCLKIGDKLIVIAESLPNRYRYQVAAHHYLAMTQIAFGRHDRAVNEVSKMVRLARESGDVSLWSRSMMTLGRVHLSFRHFDAAARAWERLVLDIDDAVPKAWLLHEIGRCYFEMKHYTKSLVTAERCIEYANEGNSRKWLLHGKLLSGQSLVELGRFGEAIGALKNASNAARDEQDFDTHEYISNLIDRVTAALRKIVFDDQLEERIETPDENLIRKAKSDDTLTKHIEWPKNLIAQSKTMQKPRISVSRYFTRQTKPAQTMRQKSSNRQSQRGRRNIYKRETSHLPISSFRESNDNDLVQEDIYPSEPVTQTINPLEQFPYEANLSSYLDQDEQQLTSRTRVIRNDEIKNLNEIDTYEETTNCLPDDDDDEKTNRTGKTYVLDESKKIAEEPSNVNLKNENFDKNNIEGENEEKGGEYLENIGRTKNVILPKVFYEEGIDEEEEEDEEEEDEVKEEKQVENDDEEEKDFFIDQEIFSPCGSKFSAASTKRTYVIEDKISNMCDMTSCYVDYEKNIKSHKIYNTLGFVNPPCCDFSTNITDDTIHATVDSSMYSEQPVGHSNFIGVDNNFLAKEISSDESEEKFNGSSRTSSFDEQSEMNSLETTFLDQLDPRKSISTLQSNGIAIASPQQNSMYTQSTTTCPRN